MAAIARSGLRIGVDPMGGASVAYWGAIAERHGATLTLDASTRLGGLKAVVTFSSSSR